METIFDIFGSCDSVKPSTLNTIPQGFAAIKNVPSEGVLPGKQSIKNDGPSLKGKKVLGDVGNKIKGLQLKTISNSKDSIKKSQPESYCASSVTCLSANRVSGTLEKDLLPERPLTSQLIWEDDADYNNVDKWPEVESHGPSFWSDDNGDSLWPDVETPTIENFFHAANIWDMGMKCGGEHSPSPVSQEFDEDIHFCLDLPSDHVSEMVLDESEVKFPWEM
ncbi:hypothetical protein R5R35_001771 [Gryllus longicercus]|uniref:Uncharacterized protein n=1 Tax=Gryllus longicercus TaxID=2509291 RepID=A0AAN9VXK0_9ORTH